MGVFFEIRCKYAHIFGLFANFPPLFLTILSHKGTIILLPSVLEEGFQIVVGNGLSKTLYEALHEDFEVFVRDFLSGSLIERLMDFLRGHTLPTISRLSGFVISRSWTDIASGLDRRSIGGCFACLERDGW